MTADVTDPRTGVRLVELSHPFGHGAPIVPGDADVHVERSVYHARDGVLSQKLVANMHVPTPVNAPIHLVQRGAFVGALPIDRFFGTGVIVSIPKGRWEYVTAADLQHAGPAIDHPLATSLGKQRNGPLMRRLPKRYRDLTGHDPEADFPAWNPAHKALLEAQIPTIENVGGDVAHVTGRRCTIHALPWRWMDG